MYFVCFIKGYSTPHHDRNDNNSSPPTSLSGMPGTQLPGGPGSNTTTSSSSSNLSYMQMTMQRNSALAAAVAAGYHGGHQMKEEPNSGNNYSNMSNGPQDDMTVSFRLLFLFFNKLIEFHFFFYLNRILAY